MSWNFELVAGPLGRHHRRSRLERGSTPLYPHPRQPDHVLRSAHRRKLRVFPLAPTTITGCASMPRATCTAARAADGASCASRRTAPTIISLPRRLDGHQHNNPNDLPWTSRGASGLPTPSTDRLATRNWTTCRSSAWTRRATAGSGGWELKRATFDVSRPNRVPISRDQKTLYVAQSDYSTDQPRQLGAYPINDDGSLGSYTKLHTLGIDHRA